jgi:hypothetical protein
LGSRYMRANGTWLFNSSRLTKQRSFSATWPALGWNISSGPGGLLLAVSGRAAYDVALPIKN